jgi:hypothetical protein
MQYYIINHNLEQDIRLTTKLNQITPSSATNGGQVCMPYSPGEVCYRRPKILIGHMILLE